MVVPLSGDRSQFSSCRTNRLSLGSGEWSLFRFSLSFSSCLFLLSLLPTSSLTSVPSIVSGTFPRLSCIGSPFHVIVTEFLSPAFGVLEPRPCITGLTGHIPKKPAQSYSSTLLRLSCASVWTSDPIGSLFSSRHTIIGRGLPLSTPRPTNRLVLSLLNPFRARCRPV